MAAMLHIEIVYTNEFTLDSGHQRYKDNKNRLTKKKQFIVMIQQICLI